MTVLMEKVTEQLQPLRRKLDALSERDRFALSVLGLFVGIALIFFLVWTPLANWATQSQLNYENKHALVNWIEQNRAALMAAKGSQSGGAEKTRKGRGVLSIVNDEARRHSLAIKRVEPKSDNELRVWLEEVNFNGLIKWLHLLDRRYGISVSTVSLDKEKSAGLVSATLILSG